MKSKQVENRSRIKTKGVEWKNFENLTKHGLALLINFHESTGEAYY